MIDISWIEFKELLEKKDSTPFEFCKEFINPAIDLSLKDNRDLLMIRWQTKMNELVDEK